MIELMGLQDLVINREAGVYAFSRAGRRVRYPSVTAALAVASGEMWATEEDLIRGRLIHKACALLDRDDLWWPSVSSLIRGEVEAYASFLDKTGFRAAVVEQPVACHKHRYCCTPDAAGTFDPAKVAGPIHAVVERKRGAVKWTHALQTAAQRHALRESGLLWPMRRLAVYLKPDGDYRIEEHLGASDFQDFLTVLAFHNLLTLKGERR